MAGDPMSLIFSSILIVVLLYFAIIHVQKLLVKKTSRLWNSKFHLRNTLDSNDPIEALLVIAHPDDECMFFTPTIVTLRSLNIPVHILCLSTGDANGLGKARQQELIVSCTVLGTQAPVIVNHDRLQDGMANRWDPALIADEVDSFFSATKNNIGLILTFDSHGVSSHPNHCDVSTGVRFWHSKHGGAISTTGRRLFVLKTVSIFEKYIGPFLILLSCPDVARGEVIVMPQTSPFSTGWSAMRQHVSQLVWFRYIFMFTTSYQHINIFEEINSAQKSCLRSRQDRSGDSGVYSYTMH